MRRFLIWSKLHAWFNNAVHWCGIFNIIIRDHHACIIVSDEYTYSTYKVELLYIYIYMMESPKCDTYIALD
jgi:hypothetical protein